MNWDNQGAIQVDFQMEKNKKSTLPYTYALMGGSLAVCIVCVVYALSFYVWLYLAFVFGYSQAYLFAKKGLN